MVEIVLEALCKRFVSRGSMATAVDDVSLAIPGGSLFFLLGPSGCGKTTLLRMIAGFTLPTAGRILFDQHDISFVPPHRRDTGMVFQSYALWPHMTVAENVAFGLNVRKIKNPGRDQRVREALAMVQMEHLLDRRPNQLSGGQQQRVALARALAIRPKCLLLDEPLSNLDAKLRLEMRSEIRRIVKQAGTTAIYVTHDQKEALSMADSIAVLRAGKLEQTGTPEELYRRPLTRFVADFIGESNFLTGVVESVDGATIVVRSAAGLIRASIPHQPGSALPGQNVTLAFRPESASLAAGEAAGQVADPTVNVLSGRRIGSSYLGDMAEHLIALAGCEKPIKVFQLNPRAAPQGTAVTLQIPVEQVIVVDSTSD